MANITVISVGSLKEAFWRDAASEYVKRISQYARVTEQELREVRISNEDDEAEIKRALDAEGEKILSTLPRDAFKIALCVEGKQYSSPELASVISDGLDTSGKIAFVIGSSHGLAEAVKAKCDLRLSFSRLTFPHQLMKPVLLEAIYRSLTIIAGKKYHK